MSEEDRAVFVQCGLEGKTSAAAALLVGAGEGPVKKRRLGLRGELRVHPIRRDFDPSEF